MSELLPPGVPPPGPGRGDCPHDSRIEGVCAACGHCTHEVILNGACLYCGTTEIDPVAQSPRPELIRPERLVRDPNRKPS